MIPKRMLKNEKWEGEEGRANANAARSRLQISREVTVFLKRGVLLNTMTLSDQAASILELQAD